MRAGDLQALLADVPAEENVIISSGRWEGPCHVDTVRRGGGKVELEGRVNFEQPAPEVTRRGRWPRRRAVPAPDRTRVVAELIRVLRSR